MQRNQTKTKRAQLWQERFSKLKSWPQFFRVDLHYKLPLFAITAGYIIIFSYITLMKYYTFHATVYDLGLWNQLYWLTLHGGPAAWNQYATNFNWQYPYHKLFFALFLPFYAAYPHPETLLVLQTTVIGLAAVPLYFLVLRYGLSRPFGLLMAFAYLAYFPVQNANLFDFQVENAFPLLFFTAVYFWKSSRKIPFAISTLTAALTSPLGLLTIMVFIAYSVFQGRGEKLSRAIAPRVILNTIRGRPTEASLFLILAFILLLEGLVTQMGSSYIGPYLKSSGITSIPLWQLVTISPDAKITYFAMLLAPLMFLSLLDPLTWMLSIPFAAFTIFSADQSHWQLFGLQYPLAWAPILFFGAVRALRMMMRGNHSMPDSTHLKLNNARIIRQVGIPLLCVILAFATIYSPLGPLNPYIKGGYGAGNEDLNGIIHMSASEAFLEKLVNLVPENASVLTQNDIPQLTGRYRFQAIAPWTGPPAVAYDYILADSQSFWFDGIQKYVNDALQSKSFGVLGMGFGDILLERGYTGSPLLFVPFNMTWEPQQLPLLSGYQAGSIIVHNSSSGGTDATFWYGPYVSLPPGLYQVNFTLEVQSTTPANASIITLDVFAGPGAILSSSTLKLGNFNQPNTWETFYLKFRLTEYTTGIEFRGMYVTNATAIALSNIYLSQIGS